MHTSLSPLEYEGLEYLLSRLINTYQEEIEDLGIRRIRSCIQRTATGIQFLPNTKDPCRILGFILQGIYLQDGTCILIAHDTKEAGYPLLIDMTPFLNQDGFNIDLLIEKMYQCR